MTQNVEISLLVNGQKRAVQVRPEATLLHVLREQFGFGSVREGCGIGMCGTCTILMDGKAVSSCLMLAVQAQGRAITTIEGLSQDGNLHPVQQAYLQESAFQCAFCTSGFILATIALLSINPAPADEEIREYLSGNICRCGSYENILKAVKRVSFYVRV